ncbi:hypothetical protein L596_014985 [Steinernema carpocapsae]|uniref:Uncharacterized protein n=1 Tax=Steinernema carpocapsae TaxID=34508 RepID=A0A4U5NEF2_STECR|nr:hypothetical protein L596_014985 [Steinernema carpocapsae]
MASRNAGWAARSEPERVRFFERIQVIADARSHCKMDAFIVAKPKDTLCKRSNPQLPSPRERPTAFGFVCAWNRAGRRRFKSLKRETNLDQRPDRTLHN